MIKKQKISEGGDIPPIEDRVKTCYSNSSERKLDTLARILEGGSECAAACLIDGEMWIASNKLFENTKIPQNTYYFFVQKTLEYFISLSTDQQLNRESAFKLICKWNLKSLKQDRLSKSAQEKIIDEFWKNLNSKNDYFENLTINDLLRMFCSEAPKPKEELPKLQKGINKLTKIRRDFIKFEKALISKKSIKIAFSNVNAKKSILLVGPQDMHAEMRILEFLIKKYGNVKNLPEVYIGISKLACINCRSVILAINSELRNTLRYIVEKTEIINERLTVVLSRKPVVNVRGFHRLNSKWIAPSFLNIHNSIRLKHLDVLKDLPRSLSSITNTSESESVYSVQACSERSAPLNKILPILLLRGFCDANLIQDVEKACHIIRILSLDWNLLMKKMHYFENSEDQWSQGDKNNIIVDALVSHDIKEDPVTKSIVKLFIENFSIIKEMMIKEENSHIDKAMQNLQANIKFWYRGNDILKLWGKLLEIS